MTGNTRQDERAVSETVGFILIFGIVMAGIGLVTLFGYPALLSQQANANIQNMEKNMIVLQNDLNSLTFKNVPYQETTMQVAGGVLSVINPDASYLKSFTINDGSSDLVSNFKTGEVRFTSNEENVIVALQNGAVVKWQVGGATGGSTTIAEPRWYYDSSTKTLIITLIKIQTPPAKTLTQTGIGTVSMYLENSPDDIIQPIPPGQEITITYSDSGDYLTAWRNFFSSLGAVQPSGAILKRSDVETLVIKQYYVTILTL